MIRDIKNFAKGQYDLLVIGGGINGAGIAHCASSNGLKTALLEKNDFACGTSSKSTKLAHGGLRYLENLEIGLVKESLAERSILLKKAPHLVKPLSFIIPVYKKEKRPLWYMNLGVTLYDFLCGKQLIHKHKKLSVVEVLQAVRGIKSTDLEGGILYYDAQMDDVRLVLENVLSADHHGADVANYCEVKSIITENGKAVGVKVLDKISNLNFEVRAKRIICAVGPWTNIFRRKERSKAPAKIRTTKGVHIVYRGQISEHALFIPTLKDKRMFFIIPFKGNTLIGTTDTDYDGDPEDVAVDDKDINYLFNECNRMFPKKEFKKNNIISTFAGLRPLVFKEGSPSKLSRNHVIEKSYNGITYIMGGKYTTYRKIAEDALKAVYPEKTLKGVDEYELYGGKLVEDDFEKVARDFHVEKETLQYLITVYGSRYKDVLGLIYRDEKLKEKVFEDQALILAQIKYSFECEMAQTTEDIILRRLCLDHFDIPKVGYEGRINSLINTYINE